MIKVLFFVDTTLAAGGAEKALRELVNNMDQSRFDITVQTVWKEDARKYLASGIRYRYFFKNKNRITKFLFRLETAMGISYFLHMKDNYDVEIAYLEYAPVKVLARSCNANARKLTWVHCDFSSVCTEPKQFQNTIGKWYDKFDKVVCVCNTVKDSFDYLSGKCVESVVLNNVVDDAMIRAKAKEQLPENIIKHRFTIVTVGRLYPVKGYDRLLEAVNRLHQEGFFFDLWILGEGPDRALHEKYVMEHDLQNYVKLIGFEPNPYPFMEAADMVVCSSLSEGFSTMVTEALILGKPVVTTLCSGMRELLGNSEYGLIVENSTEGIYSGIRALLEEPEQLRAYELKAKIRGEYFTKQKLVNQTECFIADAQQK